MSTQVKKIIYGILGAVAFLLLATGAALYFTYAQSIRNEGDIKLPAFSLNPARNIKLGDVIIASLQVNCPWGHYPEAAELTTVEGVQIVSEPVFSKVKNKWGKSVWDIKAEIQPYRTGKIKPERCVVTFLSGKEGKNSRQVATTIPGFEVLGVDTGKKRELDLAAKVIPSPISSSKTWVMIAIAILAFAGVVIFAVIWFNKRKKYLESIVIPPWILALSMLSDLRAELQNRLINKQLCITRLTDIVRNYLEKRFAIPITAKTTHEFLNDLDKGRSPLDSEYRNFLRDFLTASDLVKFAKVPADASLVENAMKKAEDLVTSTTPTKEELEAQGKETE